MIRLRRPLSWPDRFVGALSELLPARWKKFMVSDHYRVIGPILNQASVDNVYSRGQFFWNQPTGFGVTLLGVALVMLTGCGSSDPKLQIEGRLEYKGQPVPRGTAIFGDRSGYQVTANLRSDGGFTLIDVRPGTYQVAVQIPRHLLNHRQPPTAGQAPPSAEGEPPRREESVPPGFVLPIPIPEKFGSLASSGIEVTIAADSPQPLVISFE
jgi:hypothetical protein